jgi:hypothetical protein
VKVPVVGIDRIGPEDRSRIRTELRRAQFSAYEVDGLVVVITGRVDVVRAIAFRFSTLTPRVRKIEVDGDEINEAHDAPGQFRERV